MNYLTGLGHRRIGHITGRLQLVSGNQRLQGYKDGLAKAGISVDEALIEIGDFSFERAEEAAYKLLSLQNRPTAIFVANDVPAAGVYQAANGLGLKIPDDISIIGFDNLRNASLMNPPLTTVDQYISEMGRIATEMIVKLINGEKLQSNLHVIQTNLNVL